MFGLVTSLMTGCALIPDVAHQPQYHNPWPQLHRVAILPFYNMSDEPTLDGEEVAKQYFAELQAIPNFEVVPVGVTQAAITALEIETSDITQLRKLGRHLGVDAIVVGAVTDYSPYSPQRFGLKVNWFATNPCFHRIPAGYGLPFGTAEEEYIPDSLVREAEFELARAQLTTQTPQNNAPASVEPLPFIRPAEPEAVNDIPLEADPEEPSPMRSQPTEVRTAGYEAESLPEADRASKPSLVPWNSDRQNSAMDQAEPNAQEQPAAEFGVNLPDNWPSPSGFIPASPTKTPVDCVPFDGPIITHVRVFHAGDADFMTALENYFHFQNDVRFGGHQAYLQRSDDFIRFSCHLHITQMLAARGGADETRLVLRWPIGR